MALQTRPGPCPRVVCPNRLYSSRPIPSIGPNAVRSAKRAKYAPGKEKGQTITITVEPDGSDAWRLGPIIDLIKEGAVSFKPLIYTIAMPILPLNFQNYYEYPALSIFTVFPCRWVSFLLTLFQLLCAI